MTHPVRLGVLRLADAAPAVLAEAEGLFAAEGVEVALQVEPSWANVIDKLGFHALEAAVLLPPLALAAVAGLRGAPSRILVPMGLSHGGNAIAVSPRVPISAAPDAAGKARNFVAWASAQPARPRFAVVHVFSTHNLLLRHWLGSAGVAPDELVETVAVPPDRVVDELAEGRIAGFCAGAPWGEVAEATGAGRVLLGSSAIRPGHAEKCLAVAAPWAETSPGPLAALVRALKRARVLCTDPARAPALAALLAARLGLPEAATRAALPGGGGIELIRFDGSPLADRADAAWFLGEMARWGWLPPSADPVVLAEAVYRPELIEK